MNIRPLRTTKDYHIACERIDEIFNAEPGSPEDDELEILLTLVDKYEEADFKIETPHPIEAIKIQMANLNISRKDLMVLLRKSSGRVSDILNCRRPLTLNDIRQLSERLRIPVAVLSQKYGTMSTPTPDQRRGRECCTT